MHNFKNLDIWKKGVSLVTDIYLITRDYPKFEVFGLSSQTQRAATSIPLNIAERSSKKSYKDFCRFLEIAIGSSFELETALVIASNLKYINESQLIQKQNQISELQRMIYGFINGLK